MKVYDRYYGDPTSERNRYMREEINSRFNTMQKNRFIVGAVLKMMTLITWSINGLEILMEKRILPIGLQLLDTMMENRYSESTINTTVGLFRVTGQKKALAQELLEFIKAGHTERDFWKVVQEKLARVFP